MIQLPKPVKVKAVEPHKIYLEYSDGKSGVVDVSHLLANPAFKQWNDEAFFASVFIVENGRCIAWNEVLELCPDSLYLDLIGKKYEEYAAY